MALDYKERINSNIECFEKHKDNYKVLSNVCEVLKRPTAEIIGRKMTNLREGLQNPEKPNVILLGEPGAGKTAFIQGFAYSEDGQHYLTLTVNIEKFMTDANGNKDAQIANGLVDLITDVKKYSYDHDILVLLFIDEFHSIVEFSNAATQKLKPILEESASYGFRIVAATTFEEFDQFIAPDRALDQRLTRINIPELIKEIVIEVLKGRAKRHGVIEYCDPNIYGEVYDISKQVEPSKSQPRASVDIFNNIIGNITKSARMHKGKVVREFYTPEELDINSDYSISRPVLNKVIRRTYNIDIDNEISIRDLKDAIHDRLLGQYAATVKVIGGLELMMVGLSAPDKPKFSFLSTGSTGVGKTELAKIISDTLQIPLKRFDMSRYSRPEQAKDFADDLALAAWSNPNAYILIDEIEKSSREAVYILLQVLDDARLSMGNNARRIASFVGNIINITTNVGSEMYRDHKAFSGQKEINTNGIYGSLKNSPKFAPEVLGRIDEIVPFVPLSDDVMMDIAIKELMRNVSIVETKKRIIHISPDIIPYVVIDKTSRDTDNGGARDAKRQVRNLVMQKIATYLGDNPDREVPLVVYVAGRPRFKFTDEPDPNSGWIELSECYDQATVTKVLKSVSAKIGRTVIDKGIYVPKHVSLNDFATEVVKQVRMGNIRLKSTMDCKKLVLQPV